MTFRANELEELITDMRGGAVTYHGPQGASSGTAKSDLCYPTSSSTSADDIRHRRHPTITTEEPEIDEQSMWLNGLVVSALEIRARGPRFESRVAPIFHWVATLGKLFTHTVFPVSQLQVTAVQKRSFSAPKWLW